MQLKWNIFAVNQKISNTVSRWQWKKIWAIKTIWTLIAFPLPSLKCFCYLNLTTEVVSKPWLWLCGPTIHLNQLPLKPAQSIKVLFSSSEGSVVQNVVRVKKKCKICVHVIYWFFCHCLTNYDTMLRYAQPYCITVTELLQKCLKMFTGDVFQAIPIWNYVISSNVEMWSIFFIFFCPYNLE